MERLVIFGKGGIGKSTTASNLSAVMAAEGKRVLHVGCDPKHDSTAGLLGGKMITPVVDRITNLRGLTPEDIVTRSPLGIDCVEAGGPEAGVGCGGRGISRMLEIFQSADLLSPSRYDVCLYDVLGDVVCGGFASPLRKGIGEKVVIVASEEVMALYAANNIARAVVHYASNGVALAGLIVNLRDNHEDRGPIERFAKLINTRILGYLPRDPLVREAEYRRMTVAEYAPASPFVAKLRELTSALLDMKAADLPLPTPLEESRFYELTQRKFALAPGDAGAGPAAAAPAVAPEEHGPLLSIGRLTKHVPSAEERRASYERELRAGRRAVRMARVSAEEATKRLRQSFPGEAGDLQPRDLVS